MLHAVAEIDADHFGVVVGVEGHALLFVAAAELVVVGHVAVVDRRQVGDAVGPERLRVAQVDPALGRHPGVADGQRAAPGRDGVGRLELRRRADLLDQVEPASQAEDFQPAPAGAQRPLEVVGRDARAGRKSKAAAMSRCRSA